MHLLQPAELLEKTAALQAADAAGKILAREFSKVSADDSGKEPARRDLADIMSHKWQDHIPGGLAEGKKPSDFPSADLVLGMTVEMEHTSDPSIACEIAMDHLTEKPDYYRKGDMAKEVAESLGKVEDGSITLAKQAGVLMACMSKEALFGVGALKGVGKLLRPAEGAIAKGVTGGIEHSVGKLLPLHDAAMGRVVAPGALDPIQAAVARAHPKPYTDPVAHHLLETGKAMPAGPAGGWSEKANKNIAARQQVTPRTGGSMGGDAGFHNGTPGAPPPTGANPVGSVASPGPAVKRFGWGKALAVGGLGAGAYGAAKAIPWAARQVEQTSAMPLAYGGGWSPTPYGYGYSPYGSGVQTMGPGA